MINDYLNEWLHHLEINKNYSEHTFQSYGRDLKEYLKYCKINQIKAVGLCYENNKQSLTPPN